MVFRLMFNDVLRHTAGQLFKQVHYTKFGS
jgi:hypothetical protein